jgi:CheY-like chemotaxis protein
VLAEGGDEFGSALLGLDLESFWEPRGGLWRRHNRIVRTARPLGSGARLETGRRTGFTGVGLNAAGPTADVGSVTAPLTNETPRTLDVVIAEDEASIAAVVARILSGMGHEVRVCRDGAEALAAVEDRVPDLVLSDYQMPNVDGLELAQRLAAADASAAVKVILVTARGHRLSDDDLSKTNVARVLPKPFGRKDLMRAVEDAFPCSGDQAA